jgi:Kef-type K+ transport system membrane component KefB
VVSIEFHLLYDIVVIFAIAVVVLYLCHRLKIPSIVGFLFTGILAGPYGIALVKSVEQVESIAEIGVIFLLFSIGLEFSFKSLISIKKTILLGGSIQVGFTILFTFIIARLMNMPANQAIFLGFLVSLSSTAVLYGWCLLIGIFGLSFWQIISTLFDPWPKITICLVKICGKVWSQDDKNRSGIIAVSWKPCDRILDFGLVCSLNLKSW